MNYSQDYWDNYYGGSYETTFQYGFPLDRILEKEWGSVYNDLPDSFADIGCGFGQTLLTAQSLLLPNALIYGVESQELPKERIVSQKIYYGDFLKIYPQLPQVELLYVACSMYIPWERQAEFLMAAISLAKKALVFANIYIEDGLAIPNDVLRKSIYRDRAGFRKAVESLGYVFRGSRNMDFFIPA